jgi:hypothetical protein
VRIGEQHYVVCERCGLLLWFVSLEDLGVNTSDWQALDLDELAHIWGWT